MTGTSIIGTIKDIDIAEISNLPSSCYLELEEYAGWFITSESNTCRDCSSLKKGKKYLFCGELYVYKPKIFVHEFVAENSSADLVQLMQKRSDCLFVAVTGRITEARIIKTEIQKVEMAYLKFDSLPDISVVVFPDLWKDIRNFYKIKKEITVIGEFSTEKPQFIVEQVNPLSS